MLFSGDFQKIFPIKSVADYVHGKVPETNFFLAPVCLSRYLGQYGFFLGVIDVR